MAKRYNNADPTANTAAKNVDRERRLNSRPGRRLLDEFAAEFAGLMPHEIRQVALQACALADGDVWKINADHINAARKAVGR